MFVCQMGCTTTGYQKGDSAAQGMQRAAAEVQAEGRAMDQTVQSLQALISSENGDLRAPFKRYCRSLDYLVRAAQRTENTGRNMDEKNQAYLQAWDQQLQTIDYQHIRDLSEARRSEVTNHLEAIRLRYTQSQEAIRPLIVYFEDIRRALSADLTEGGLESLRGIAQNANDNVAKVQTALDALTAELTKSSAHLSSVAYQRTEQTAQMP
ncbi:MAG TPA: DUF2959 family protein [Verrucomicrobiae bacterium]|nr:DUF2959 family protein [Verrucomicrobiae bacterium]